MLALAVISSVILAVMFIFQFMRIGFTDSGHSAGVVLCAWAIVMSVQAFLQTALWILYSN